MTGVHILCVDCNDEVSGTTDQLDLVWDCHLMHLGNHHGGVPKADADRVRAAILDEVLMATIAEAVRLGHIPPIPEELA